MGFWKDFARRVGIADGATSTADFVGRILSWLLIGGGGVVTAEAGGGAPFLDSIHAVLGGLTYVTLFFVGAFLTLGLILLHRKAQEMVSKEEYNRKLANLNTSKINPLATLFEDQVIAIEDLRLPVMQMHEGKIFRRCEFVGPGAICLNGGKVRHNRMYTTGSFIPISMPCQLTGFLVFQECIFENNEFHRIQFMGDADLGNALGLHIAGDDIESKNKTD